MDQAKLTFDRARDQFVSECDFCLEFERSPWSTFGRLFGSVMDSRILWRSASLVALPSLGAISPGHLLLMPVEHVTSLAHLTEPDRRETEAIASSLQTYLAQTFLGPVVLFEHGLLPDQLGGGCGVDHAHLHFIPVSQPPSAPPTAQKLRWTELCEDRWLDRLLRYHREGTGYVFLRLPTQPPLASGSQSLPSQFMRRWIAQEIGQPLWDWRSFGFDPSLVRVMRELKASPTPTGMRDA